MNVGRPGFNTYIDRIPRRATFGGRGGGVLFQTFSSQTPVVDNIVINSMHVDLNSRSMISPSDAHGPVSTSTHRDCSRIHQPVMPACLPACQSGKMIGHWLIVHFSMPGRVDL